MQSDEQQSPSVWTRPRHAREQPALTPAQIVAAAIALLDAEGVEALSMRRLGSRLNAGATSLYRHVANKDELIELAVDEVYGELRPADAADPGDWRGAAAAHARGLRAAILRHPWIASVIGGLGLAHLGANAMRFDDGMLGVFEAAGFDLEEADLAMSALVSYVVGTATAEAAWLTTLARSGRDEAEWVERIRPAAEAAVQEFPRLRRLYAGQQGADPRSIREGTFDYGLERVLDGLAARLGRS